MDIAIDIRSLSEGRHSGVEEYTTNIINSMVKIGRSHTFHLFHNSARAAFLPQFSGDVTIHAWRYPNKVFNMAQWITGRPLWDRMVKADCFFVPNFRIIPLSPHVPLVTTVHDLSFDLFPEFFSFKRQLWHGMVNPKMIMQNSDHLIAVSEASASNMIKLYNIPAEKISVVHSGIKKEKATASQIKAVRYKYSLPQRYVLYFGVMEPRKNIPGIIDAFSLIADKVPHDLVIAGEKGWLQKDIKRAIDNSPYADRIHLPGFVDEIDKPSLYAAADLFVFPSFYEGFGFPPLEALVAGTPVVTSCNSSLPEIVGKWADLVDPYNITELSLVMKELLLDPPLIDSRVVKEIEKTYTWDKAARDTLNILEAQV